MIHISYISFTVQAVDVEIKDDSFTPEDFEISQGNTHVQWARIAPYPFIQQ